MKKDLYQKIAGLGFPLLSKENEDNVNQTLAEVVQSPDIRLWEGFPLMLARAYNNGEGNYQAIKTLLNHKNIQKILDELISISLALYNVTGFKYPWMEKLSQKIGSIHQKIRIMEKDIRNGQEIKVGGKKLSPERMKNNLANYSLETQQSITELLSVKQEFGLEYALSQFFSPKQKELILKKLRSEKLNKTEKEYFSRTVKKKLTALLNGDLQRIAQKILQ
jgi:hypothetical protein